MGPMRDPIRPLGVKHKGIASFKEHKICSCSHPVELGDGRPRFNYGSNFAIFHIKLRDF
ncbi:MAG: hypothetical protein ACI9B9_001846 [Halioglobus sp.]|jgi:hypothetical protein